MPVPSRQHRPKPPWMATLRFLVLSPLFLVTNGFLSGTNDEEEESEDSPDSPVETALSVALPSGLVILAVGLYCGQHHIRRGWQSWTQKADKWEAEAVQRRDLWPLVIPSLTLPEGHDSTAAETNDQVICKDHQEEICPGCCVDFSLLNQIRSLPEYKSVQAKDKSKRLALVEAKTKAYIEEIAVADLESAYQGSNLTIPLPDSVELLLKDRDPVRVVHGFASICYALRSTPDHRLLVDQKCYELAVRATEIVGRLQEKLCLLKHEAEPLDCSTCPKDTPGENNVPSQQPPSETSTGSAVFLDKDVQEKELHTP